ncbi:unnamed protein product [Gordionus sp. m RMFG-2023]
MIVECMHAGVEMNICDAFIDRMNIITMAIHWNWPTTKANLPFQERYMDAEEIKVVLATSRRPKKETIITRCKKEDPMVQKAIKSSYISAASPPPESSPDVVSFLSFRHLRLKN